MLKYKTIFFCLIILTLILSCENIFEPETQKNTFVKMFGSYSEDQGYDIKALTDGGFIIVGTTSTPDNGLDMIVIKTNSMGNQLQSVTIGGILDEYGRAIEITDAGEYIAFGSKTDSIFTGKSGSTETNFYVVRLDENLNIQTEKNYGSNYNEFGTCMCKTSDGGFILAGETTENTGGILGQDDFTNIILTKINGDCDSLWTKKYGGQYSETVNSILRKPNDGFIMVGSTSSFAEVGQANMNMLVIETNKNGVEIDQKTFGGQNNDRGESLIALDNGGYLFVGSTESYGQSSNILIIKTAPLIHSVTWQLNSLYSNSNDYGKAVQADETGIYILGETESSNIETRNMLLIKLDQNGNILFDKTYGEENEGLERAEAILQTDDGGLILLGSTAFKGNSMISLIKTLENGEFN